MQRLVNVQPIDMDSNALQQRSRRFDKTGNTLQSTVYLWIRPQHPVLINQLGQCYNMGCEQRTEYVGPDGM